MSYPPEYGSDAYGYSHQQPSPQTNQQSWNSQLPSYNNGYMQDQRRDAAATYHVQGSPALLPASQPQTQLQSWQQTNGYPSGQYYTAQTSPQFIQSMSPAALQNMSHFPGQHMQHAWSSAPQRQPELPQSVHQPTPYPSAVYTSSPPMYNQQMPQGVSYGHMQTPQSLNTNQEQHAQGQNPASSALRTLAQMRGKLPSSAGIPSAYSNQTKHAQAGSTPFMSTQVTTYKQEPLMESVSKQDHPSTTKRRKSNDGSVLVNTPQAITKSIGKLKGVHHQLSNSSPLSALRSLQVPPPPSLPGVDLNTVLFSLADEYITAAHNMAPTLMRSGEIDLQHYHRLIATAIHCLDSSLTNFRHTDLRQETYIRLRLATLMFEETTDTERAEGILSKGIAVCEHGRLLDLQYTMQHLMIRMVHTNRPKAAYKAIAKILAEVQASHLDHWILAFRFLKVSLSLAESSFENVTVLRELAAINELAHKKSRAALCCLTSCLETMVHLRNGSPESIEAAQRAMAAARSYQLDPEMSTLPQLKAMLSILNMTCTATTCMADLMHTTSQQMHNELEAASKDKGWSPDGSFQVSLGGRAADHLKHDTAGIFTTTDTGEITLTFHWLTKAAVWTTGYTLSGIAFLPRSGESRKSEAFFNNALKINTTDTYNETASLIYHQLASENQNARATSIKLMKAFTCAARAQYREAMDVLHEIDQNATTVLNEIGQARLRYLTAACKQGLGQPQQALKLYSWSLHAFDPEKKAPTPIKDIQVLSILSSIHLLRAVARDGAAQAGSLLESVQSYCFAHPNKSFASAYNVIEATTAPANTTMIATKESLNKALTPAQVIKSKQLLTIIMNMMSEMFFADIVGGQAMKSANAARTLARQSGDNLWVAVGCGMLRDTMQRSGMLKEAVDANDWARSAVTSLPKDLKMSLSLD